MPEKTFTSYQFATVVELVRHRSRMQAEELAYTFLADGETEAEQLTYQELDRRSKAIASQLQVSGLSGERALLLFPPGLDYLAAFFGCLYAGVVAVPAYPPRNQRNTPRIEAILADSTACVALTTTAIFSTVQSLLTGKTAQTHLQWLITDNLDPGIEDSWQEPFITSDTLAFLQYTSGSTGTPKGVMVSHGNLLHNAATTYQVMEHSAESRFVSWLPAYHDMGLIGGILQPLYGGFPCILMSPTSFLQRPYRWLYAISKYKGTTSGGPNFAYDLCSQKITPEQIQTLDLSSWSVAFNGAEPIRHETLERFAATFASCGFRKEAFYPCYGMAEATLMISGSQKATLPIVKTVEKAALESNRVVESTEDRNTYHLVSCGQSIPEQKVVIANPHTLSSCQPHEVGEIWVCSPSVGQGYWNRCQETEQTFHAYLSDTGEGPFLRTGDLGFVRNGELFITGRVKDLIIIRGRNLYPQDIELTVERSHPSLRSASGAAFAVEMENEERLVVVQELEFRAKPNVEEVVTAIRQAVTEEHEVQVYAVVLIKAGSIPKTSSGKIQRRATRAQFQAQELQVVASSIAQSENSTIKENSLTREALLALTPNECESHIESYLVEIAARLSLLAPSQIKKQQALSSLGIDSLKVFEFKNQIESDLEVTVSVADFFEGSTISDLTKNILAALKKSSSSSASLTKITRKSEFYPVSFSQKQLWFIHQIAPDSCAYHINIIINFVGKIDPTALTESLKEIIQRHEVLRTNFVVLQDEPVQVIHNNVNFSLPIEDLRKSGESEQRREIQRLTTDVTNQPFDLSRHLLIRGLLLRLKDEEYKLILSLHHIIADGWSIGIVIQELASLYEALSHKQSSPLSELPIQYVDFTYWQQQYLQPERVNTLLTYWKQQLGGKLPVLNLPTDRPRAPIQSYKGARETLVMSQTIAESLKHLSQQEGTTLYMTLLAAFKILLYRYTGQIDILVGSPIASRNRAEIQPLIGFFVNVLVMRTNLSGTFSFKELLARVRQIALEAYVHQDLPFEKLVQELKPERDLSYNPLFQVMFVLQNVPIPTPKLSDISIHCEEGYNGTSKFDLTLFVEEREQGLVTTFEYNSDLFNAETINRMLGHFATLVEGIVANPDSCIINLPVLTASERHQLILDWNNTKKNYPYHLCIHQLFEQQVERTPNAVALDFEKQQLTYRELNNRANQLAHDLQKLGVKPEVLVGIYMERSLEMVIGLLAILKAGGAYLPLDPTYPQERLGFMLSDTQVRMLLTQQHLVKKLPPHQAQVICVNTDSHRLTPQNQENPVSDVKPENLAYVIYTSGSTGTPKGVMNTHQGLSNRLLWMQDAYQLNASDRVLQKTPFTFDVSIWEFFWPLLTGARLVLAKVGGHQDSSYLVELIAEEKITTLHFVPSMLRLFLEEPGLEKCHSLKSVICSGEALAFDLQERFFARLNAELHNLYGPTEAAIDVTFWNCRRKCSQGIVPIGRPIANTQIYILDKQLQPVPIGIAGELHIGGVGLARGYLNRPELTDEKFISNPFSPDPKVRLYKTGDLARYHPDGTIEFLGRIDHQVKIRGFRIELGEIEAILVQHPAVREVLVLAREEKPDDKQLVAYIVVHQEQTPTTSELRNYLKGQLPEYMVPAVFMVLDTMPLLPNGKVDRRALPIPEGLRPTLTTTYQPPQSQIEQAIAKIWQEALHLDKVGIHDNFFDLGGHSLLMVQVAKKLSEILQQNVLLVTLFQNPTIDSLAQHFKQQQQPGFKQIRERAQKQIEAMKRQKQLLNNKGRKING
jgi:amino acid adenylation domain-containing protein